MRTKQIKTIERVFQLAEKRKSVINKYQDHPTPAAFVIGYPARVLRNMIKGGVLFEYKKI